MPFLSVTLLFLGTLFVSSFLVSCFTFGFSLTVSLNSFSVLFLLLSIEITFNLYSPTFDKSYLPSTLVFNLSWELSVTFISFSKSILSPTYISISLTFFILGDSLSFTISFTG